MKKLALLAWLLYRALRDRFPKREQAILLAVATCTMPTFQASVSYLSNAHHVIACLMSWVAASLARRGLRDFAKPREDSARWPKNSGFGYGLTAAAVLYATLCTYPPAAMFYWFLLGVFLFDLSPRPEGRLAKAMLYLGGIGLLSMGAYYVHLRVLALGLRKVPDYLAAPDGHMLTLEPLAHLGWFVRVPLTDALNLWNIWPKQVIAVWVGGLVALGLVLRFCRDFTDTKQYASVGKAAFRSAAKCLALLGIVLLTFAPNLATVHKIPYYRCMLALAPYLLFLVAQSVYLLAQAARRFLRTAESSVVTGILGVACCVGIWSAHYNMQNYFAFSIATEVLYIKSAIRAAGPRGFERIVIVKPDPEYGLSFVTPRGSRADEFAAPATGFAQDIPFLVRGVILDLNAEAGQQGKYPDMRPEVVDKSKFKGARPRDLVIDMSRLRGFY